MLMSIRKSLIFAASLAVLYVSSEASAANRWALGGFLDYNSPTRALKDRFDGVRKFSGAMSFAHSDAVTMSLEYSRASFSHGKLETMPFKWAVDDKLYTSPNGSSTMKLTSYLINAMVYPGQANQSHAYKAREYRWYFLIGGGYTNYKAVNKNFIYPGQTGGTTKTLDPTKLLDPEVDKRMALAANVGAGVEGFIADNWALDVRVRYNFIVGEMRPLLLWNLDRIFPLQLIDLGVGMKFYFGR